MTRLHHPGPQRYTYSPPRYPVEGSTPGPYKKRLALRAGYLRALQPRNELKNK
ncbi:hypothetical protein LINPERPRIM_LOCUS22532, partial [Linum perenne]